MTFPLLKKLSAIVILVLCACVTNAQMHEKRDEPLVDINRCTELNITLGANNFLGDLGGNLGIGRPGAKDYMFKTIRPLVGVAFTNYRTSWLGIRGGINFSSVNGADSLITNEGGYERWRYYRNLSFRSSIVEANINADIYPLMIVNKRVEIMQIAPFITVGVGAFHFNPKTKYNGNWVDLQPLSLEGQGFAEYPDRKPYKLTQIYIPISLGVKYYINNTYALSFGATFRHTWTDYIDDISTTYIDPTLFYKYLPADKAGLAYNLYSRSLTPSKVKPGVEKAHHYDNDSYVTVFAMLSIRLSKGVRFYYGGM